MTNCKGLERRGTPLLLANNILAEGIAALTAPTTFIS